MVILFFHPGNMELKMIELTNPVGRTLEAIGGFVTSNMNLEFVPNSGSMCLVVIDENQSIVGLAYTYENFLKYLCVDKNCRRMGIGRRLVERLLKKHNSLLLQIQTEVVPVGDTFTIGSIGWNFYNKHFDIETIEFGKYRLRERMI